MAAIGTFRRQLRLVISFTTDIPWFHQYAYWTCTARVESRKRKPKAEKHKGSFQNYQQRLCSPMNGVTLCKITIALAGLESRGRERKAFVVSF